jgi:hypothetical protein
MHGSWRVEMDPPLEILTGTRQSACTTRSYSRMSRVVAAFLDCCISRVEGRTRYSLLGWVACCLLLTMASPCRNLSFSTTSAPTVTTSIPMAMATATQTSTNSLGDDSVNEAGQNTIILLLEMRRQIIPLCPSGCQLHRERPRRTIWGRGLSQTRVPATPPVRPGALRSAK